MNIKKIFYTLVAALLIGCSLPFSAFATGSDTQAIQATLSAPAKVTDGKISTRQELSGGEVHISAQTPLRYLYIIFWDEPVDFTLTNSDSSTKFEGKFLHRLVELPQGFTSGEMLLSFADNANVSEIAVYTEDSLPDTVQNWEDNNTVADLLLFSTHADDEQLFFSGVLPLYATNKNCEVQVVYFTDHSDNILRRHELLNGLWTVGVTRYPVISPFPDAYSESYDWALSNLKRAGFTEDDALGFQVEQIRRFQPLVILGHDLKGEYGHGQHILNANLLTRAVEAAADSTQFTTSAELYGHYNTPKLYLHLYEQNQVVLDLDTPIDGIGKTPFQLSQAGYACHNTQQGYWFTQWLNGNNGEITKASQIKKYSPCKFGLYRTTVGEDIQKTDLFENLTMRSLIPKPESESEPAINIEQPTGEIAPSTPISNSNLLIIAGFIAFALLIAAIIITKLITRKRKK